MKRVGFKTIAVPVAAVCVVALAVLARRDDGAGRDYFETVTVSRGTLSRIHRETGFLVSRDSTHIKTTVEGTLEWIARADDWVNEGDKVYVLNADEALVEATRARTELLALQQELVLERMRRRQSERIERQKVDAAMRQWELEKTRYRILNSEPKGGRRLIELHELLLPMEQETQVLRDRYEAAQDAYEAAQDAYLEDLDKAQAKKDLVLYHQNKADECRVRLQAKPDDTQAEQKASRAEADRALAEAESAMTALRAELPALDKAVVESQAASDAARIPRDELLAKLTERETKEKELYIELEIEKRGLKRANLELDGRAATLRRAEAARKREEGQAAFEAGAISRTQLDRLESALRTADSDLAIVKEKISIAARPEPEEVLTEARLKMERAQAQADRAGELRDRALEGVDKKIALLEARMSRQKVELDRRAAGFPEVLEFGMKFLRQEAETLEDSPEDHVRRGEIEKELGAMAVDLERFKRNPPNIGKSPVSGVAKVLTKWGRPYQTGDRVGPEEILIEVYPATNLEVQAALNEADAGAVTNGMPARVIVPALGERVFPGMVSHVSRLGRDKYEGRSDHAPAGVVQFELRVKLLEVCEELRPGMTTVCEIPVATADGALTVVREAVQRDADGYFCLTGGKGAPRVRRVTGHPFSGRAFVVEGGLAEGDAVLVRRRSSE